MPQRPEPAPFDTPCDFNLFREQSCHDVNRSIRPVGAFRVIRPPDSRGKVRLGLTVRTEEALS